MSSNTTSDWDQREPITPEQMRYLEEGTKVIYRAGEGDYFCEAYAKIISSVISAYILLTEIISKSEFIDRKPGDQINAAYYEIRLQ